MRQLTVLLLLACASCGMRAAAPSASATARAAPGLLDQIRTLAGSADCTDSSQCRTLALGARACGGPEAYLAWSSAHTDAAALQALAERYRNERKAALAKSGQLSDCRLIPDPGAQCRAGHCQLRGGLEAS